MPCLRIVSGIGEGTVADLTEATFTIGRDVDADLRIHDPKSSRSHAEIRFDGSRWELVDHGSSNGTWNGDARIQSMPLSDGFTFRIGKTLIRFESRPVETSAGDTTSMDAIDPQRLQGLDEDEPSLLDYSAGDQLTREASSYLALLHRIVLKSNEAQDREELFEVLDEAAADALEGDRCAVFLPSPDGWTLWPAHERRLRARYGAVPFARTLLHAVRQRQAPLLCTRQGDLSPSVSMVQAGVRSAMAAPLRIGEQTHALLYVDRIVGTEPFSRHDLEFLAAAANQLAVQLHNREHVATLEAEVERLQSRSSGDPVRLIHKDPQMEEVEVFIAKAAAAESPVLVRGEPGTGKELVVRCIHQRSSRGERPLLIVSCAALRQPDIELFGCGDGSADDRTGLIEHADQGSILFDDFETLDAGSQATLLSLMDRGEFTRAGDGALRRINVRFFFSTSRDMDIEVREKRFRSDVMTRIDVLSVTIPALRARPADIDGLAEWFLQESARKLGQSVKRLAPESRALLLRYAWPGNVRQLKNALERSSVLADGPQIRPEHLPDVMREPEQIPTSRTPITSLAEVERLHIQRVLDHCGGNKKAAAELLGIDRSTLYAKLRQFGQA